MRKLSFTVIAITFATLVSCGSGIDDQPANAEGFTAIEQNIKSEFGADAYYTELTVVYIESIGNTVNATVTKDPSSLEMGEWNLVQGNWNQTSEITLEVPEGSQAADFMFQLKDDISLSKLGELVEHSSTKLKSEKNIKNPTLSLAYIKYPDNGDTSKAEYVVQLKPEGGGTTFSFFYKLSGEFVNMNY